MRKTAAGLPKRMAVSRFNGVHSRQITPAIRVNLNVNSVFIHNLKIRKQTANFTAKVGVEVVAVAFITHVWSAGFYVHPFVIGSEERDVPIQFRFATD
jgi:hypothetical protein